MKRFFSMFSMLSMVIIMLFSVVRCNTLKTNDDLPSENVNNIRFKALAASDPYDNPIMFKDETNYYYMFDLGNIRGVPLQSGIDSYEYQGNDYSKSFTVEETTATSIEKQVMTATEYCTQWTHAWQASLKNTTGASVKLFEFAELSAGKSLEVGYSGSYIKTNKNTASESYKEAESYSKKISDTVSFSFNEKYPHGFYRYILMGELKIYGVVIYDYINDSYILTNYSVLVARYYTLDYCETSPKFDKDTPEILPFELDEQYIKNLPIPADKIESIPVIGSPADPIKIEFKRQSCKTDNGFDPSEEDTETDILAHSKFELFELVLMNSVKGSDGKYRIPEGEQPKLYLKVLQNLDKLPTGAHIGTVNWTIHHVADDTYCKAVYGTNISGQTIGKGAYYVKVKYTDGSWDEFNEVNIVDGASKGNQIFLDVDFDTRKIIKSVEVVCVYELYYDYMKNIWDWNGTRCYANWRCSSTLEFEP